MSEAPERIVTSQCGKTLVHDGMKRFETDVEYIRKDVSDALIAASYVDAANLHQSLWRETSAYKTDQILKRTSTDATQALDALLKAEREKALREAANVCERIRTQQINGPMPERACFDYEQSILALISEDATDG